MVHIRTSGVRTGSLAIHPAILYLSIDPRQFRIGRQDTHPLAKAHKKVQPFVIGEEKIQPGTRKLVDMPISVLADHSPVTMTVLVIHGRRPGPVMFVSAAVHGDEILGVEIIRRLVSARQIANLAGTLLAIPVVNSFGFIGHSRYMPDRRDLNRCFPGQPQGTLGSQLANIFTTEILQRSDFGIDLHTGALHRTNLPQLRISGEIDGESERANAFQVPVIMANTPPPGSLRGVAAGLFKSVIVYEAGEALRFNEQAIRAGLRGILSVMRLERMIGRADRKPARSIKPIWVNKSFWIRAPQGGIVQLLRPSGSVVVEGDILAVVADPFGESKENVVAPFAGIVIGHRTLPTVNRGDALFHLAQTSEEQAIYSFAALSEEAAEDDQAWWD